MDMFYAAVAILDNPSLKDKSIAVGDKNMCATANYHARKFGVRSAMPGFIAKKLCPELIFIKNNPVRNEEISKVFRNILSEYDPDQESLGLDESNLDVTDYLISHNMNNAEGRQKLVSEIRK